MKTRYTPAYPSSSISKWGSRGYTFHGHVSPMLPYIYHCYLVSNKTLLQTSAEASRQIQKQFSSTHSSTKRRLVYMVYAEDYTRDHVLGLGAH